MMSLISNRIINIHYLTFIKYTAMRSLFYTCFLTFFAFISFGQKNIDDNVASLKSVAVYELPALDNKSLQNNNKSIGKGDGVLRFAEPRDVNINPIKNGTWEQTNDNILVWRQRIVSPNAYSINLAFTTFYLPPSASLFIYNMDKTEVIGPLTMSDNDDHMQYWTPLINGQEVVVELQISPEEKDQYKIEIARVNHDFIDIQKSVSGSCNLDVACGSEDGFPLVDRYRDIIRAVGAYSVGGIDFCSGTLINNARNDCRPFFLTAEHCGVSNNNASSVVVYWNYENSTCRQPGSNASGGIGDGLRNQFNSGASLRSELEDSDFSLLELDDPIDPEFDLYFAGWSREIALPDSSLCIHHPGVEEKRISFDFDRLVYDTQNNGDTTHVRVLDWDIGTTEGGSSGSGIFNPEGLLIGQLTGGLASCFNNEFDFYGWMNYSWDKGPVGSRLQPWLDPDNTGLMTMQGRGCNFELIIDNMNYEVCGNSQNTIDINMTAEGSFDDLVEYNISGLPAGVSGVFDFVSNVSTVPNRLSISGLSSVGDLNFSITVSVDDGSNVADQTINITVFENIPTSPTLLSPENGIENQPLEVELSITERNNPENRFQIATDVSFTDVIVDETVSLSDYTYSGLNENQLYYWRAKSINACGESDWSEVFSFSTSNIFCASISYLGDAIAIEEDDPSEISATTNLPYLFNVEDVIITNITGTHSFISDLIVSLSFNGITSQLFSGICSDNNDFNLGFSDASTLFNIQCPPTNGEIYLPDTPLSTLDGAIAFGDWSLDVIDDASLDGGTLDSWSMDVCYSNPMAPIIVPEQNILTGCFNREIMTSVYFDAGDAIPNYEVRVVSANTGSQIPSELLVDASNPNGTILSFTPSDQDNGLATVQLINTDNNLVAFFTTIKLDLLEGPVAPVITFPISGSILSAEDFNRIEWEAVSFSGDFIVVISRSPTFDVIEFAINGNDENFINLISSYLPEQEYYIRVGLASDCGFNYSETVVITIDNSVSTTEEESLSEITVYPNPGSDIFYVKSEVALSDNHKLIIRDIQGKVFDSYTDRVSENTLKLDLSQYPSGVYYLRIVDGDQSIDQKIIKL